MSKANPLEGAQEVQQLLVDYAKQETLEPLKNLGRYLGLGLGGSILIFFGVFFTGLGTLRLLQSLDPFSGSSWMSTLPYVISMAVLGLAILAIYLTLSRAKKRVRT